MNMTPEMWVALISSAASIITVVITTRNGNREISHKLETNQAITDTKLQLITDEVRTFGETTRRMPAVEQKLDDTVRRVDALERTVSNAK